MAFIGNDEDDDILTSEPVSSGTSAPVSTPPGTQTGNIASGARTPTSNKSGTFRDLSTYLKSNTTGAQNLADRTSSFVEGQSQKADQAIKATDSDFRKQVADNTVTFDSDLARRAANDASSYVSNPNLTRQLSGSYTGPKDITGLDSFGTAVEEKVKAEDRAKLTGSEGGRTELIRQTGANPVTRGGLNFNQFLVQGTDPALARVNQAGTSAAPLNQQLTGVTTGASQAAKAAADTTAAARTNTLNTLAGGQSNLLSLIDRTLADKKAALANEQASLVAGLKAGNLNDAQLAKLGMTSEQWQSLLAGNAAIAAKGGKPVDLSTYFQGGTFDALCAGNVATGEQVADLNALAQLQGQNAPVLATGQQTPAQFRSGEIANQIITNIAALNPKANISVPREKNGMVASVPFGPGESTGGDSVGGGTGSSATSSGAPAVGMSIGQVAAIGLAVAMPSPVSIANAINAISQAVAAQASVDAAVSDSNADTNGAVSNAATATTGPSGTGAAAASAASAAAAAASAAGHSAAAIGAASQAAANAAVNGMSPDAAAAAAAAAASAADGGGDSGGSTSGDSADGTAGVGVGEGGIGSSGAGTAAGDAAGNSEGSGGAADGSGSAGDSGGGGGGGGKVICTAMADAYGLSYRSNYIWMAYAKKKLTPYHEKGYHLVFKPLVAYAYHSNKPLHQQVKSVLEWMAVNRTSDIKNELAGRPRNLLHRSLRAIIEPALWLIGRLA